jgi:large subunit ribosomal protein L17
MRHRCRVAKLSRAADQRRAMLRSLTTSLLLHGEIMTTLPRARELSRQASRMITLAKQGDVAAVRRAARYVLPTTGQPLKVASGSTATIAPPYARLKLC